MVDMKGGALNMHIHTAFRIVCLAVAAACACTGTAAAQMSGVRLGDPVPRDVRELYEAGCRYLAKAQDPSGTWKDSQQGPGVTGMALMVLLASGEDPNCGVY